MDRWGLRTVVVCLAVAGCAADDAGSDGTGSNTATEGDGGGSDGSSEGGSGGDSGDASDSGGPAGCAGYPFQATAEELAATPRDDADAEILALLTAGTFVAPPDLYERASADLTAIRVVNPMLEEHHAKWPWDFGISVAFDEDGTALLQDGTYDGWDCPNERYALEAELNSVLEDSALVSGGKRIHQARLAEEYLELANVINTEPSGAIDGSRICMQVDQDVHQYLFVEGGGDCPAGCTEFYYWLYTVNGDGDVTLDSESEQAPTGWECN